MNQFICYPKCSTCIKAKKFLDEHQIHYEFRNIKEDPLNEDELYKIYKQSNLPLKRFFNTSGLLYKENNLKEKLIMMSEEEMIKLLATNGMLVKRPILMKEDLILVGYKEDEYRKLL